MMRSIDLFVASDQALGELAEQITKVSGFKLSAGADESEWWLQEGEIRARLSSHPYIDDGDLDFRNYPYVLSCRVGAETRLADAAETVLLRLISETLHKIGVPTLLVHDLQYRDRGAERSHGQRSPSSGPAVGSERPVDAEPPVGAESPEAAAEPPDGVESPVGAAATPGHEIPAGESA